MISLTRADCLYGFDWFIVCTVIGMNVVDFVGMLFGSWRCWYL